MNRSSLMQTAPNLWNWLCGVNATSRRFSFGEYTGKRIPHFDQSPGSAKAIFTCDRNGPVAWGRFSVGACDAGLTGSVTGVRRAPLAVEGATYWSGVRTKEATCCYLPRGCGADIRASQTRFWVKRAYGTLPMPDGYANADATVAPDMSAEFLYLIFCWSVYPISSRNISDATFADRAIQTLPCPSTNLRQGYARLGCLRRLAFFERAQNGVAAPFDAHPLGEPCARLAA